MIEVKENEDGSLDISWDPDDPVESILNEWTEQDFIDAIMTRCKKVLETVEEVAQDHADSLDDPI